MYRDQLEKNADHNQQVKIIIAKYNYLFNNENLSICLLIFFQEDALNWVKHKMNLCYLLSSTIIHISAVILLTKITNVAQIELCQCKAVQ